MGQFVELVNGFIVCLVQKYKIVVFQSERKTRRNGLVSYWARPIRGIVNPDVHKISAQAIAKDRTPFTAAAPGAAGARRRITGIPSFPAPVGFWYCPLAPSSASRPPLHMRLSFPVAGLAVRSPSPLPWCPREVFDALPLCVLARAGHHSLHGIPCFRGGSVKPQPH